MLPIVTASVALKALGFLLLVWLINLVTQRLYQRSLRKGKALPLPPTHWLWGNIPDVVGYMKRGLIIDHMILDYTPKYGHLFELKLLVSNFVIITDPDATKEVLHTKNYPKSPTYSTLYPFIGEQSILVSKADAWHRSRRAFNPAFTFGFLKTLVPVFIRHARVLLDKLDKAAKMGDVVPVHRTVIYTTMDIICDTALSEQLNSQITVPPPPLLANFLKLYDIIAEFASNPMTEWMKYLPWNAYKFSKLQGDFDRPLLRIIDGRVNQLKASSALKGTGAPADVPKDILTMAIQTAAEEDNGPVNIQDILSQVKTFLFAGHDTTASTVAWALYEVARSPDIDAKLFAEVQEVVGDADPTADTLNQLKYMTALIKETLRFWPPGGSARMAPPGSTLQGYDIGGKVLWVPHFPLHRDPGLFGADAGVFRPERWLDEAYVAGLHPYAYQPFSKGPRDCIGQVFAMLEAKTLLTMLLRRYTFAFAGSEPEDIANKITSYPKHGVQLRVALRTKG